MTRVCYFTKLSVCNIETIFQMSILLSNFCFHASNWTWTGLNHFLIDETYWLIKTSFYYCLRGSGQNSVIPVVCNVPEWKLYTQHATLSNCPQTDYSLWLKWPQYVKNEDVCEHSGKKLKKASGYMGIPYKSL